MHVGVWVQKLCVCLSMINKISRTEFICTEPLQGPRGKQAAKHVFYSLLYSRWNPAATTLISVWKCKYSWLDVLFNKAGAVVPETPSKGG